MLSVPFRHGASFHVGTPELSPKSQLAPALDEEVPVSFARKIEPHIRHGCRVQSSLLTGAGQEVLSTFAASPSAAALGVAGMMPLLAYGLALDMQKERWGWVKKIDEATSSVALQIFGSERKVGLVKGAPCIEGSRGDGRAGGSSAATRSTAGSFSVARGSRVLASAADGNDHRRPISKRTPYSYTSCRNPTPHLCFSVEPLGTEKMATAAEN